MEIKKPRFAKHWQKWGGVVKIGKRLVGDGSPHLCILSMFGKIKGNLPNIGKSPNGAGTGKD
jgi:hypothetical protein